MARRVEVGERVRVRVVYHPDAPPDPTEGREGVVCEGCRSDGKFGVRLDGENRTRYIHRRLLILADAPKRGERGPRED